jgi:glyoxylase-like metal-dependent hydrolase (beta-lactamase superfamily II)
VHDRRSEAPTTWDSPTAPTLRHNDDMREVVDGVIEVPIGYVNAYVVVVDDGVVLVDTGIPGRADKVARAIEAARRRIGEVHTILLTHWHPDHVGSVAELRRRSGARVVAHAIDAQLIDGGTKAQPPKGFMRVVGAIMPSPEPVPVDEALTADGPISVPGFTAIHTPGHTRGHMSFLLDRGGGVLFAGDAAGGRRNGRIRRSPRMVTEDRAAELASIARLGDLSFESAVFGHGRSISREAAQRFREFAARG